MAPHIGQEPPMSTYGQLRPVSNWSSGLLYCTSDCNSCCLTCWCPCIAFGRIAEVVDHGGTKCSKKCVIYTLLMCFTCCHWLYSCPYRSKLRSELNIPKNPICNDCILHCLCEQCSLCQMYHELQSRGFNLSLGWQGHQYVAPTQPPVVQGMTR